MSLKMLFGRQTFSSHYLAKMKAMAMMDKEQRDWEQICLDLTAATTRRVAPVARQKESVSTNQQ